MKRILFLVALLGVSALFVIILQPQKAVAVEKEAVAEPMPYTPLAVETRANPRTGSYMEFHYVTRRVWATFGDNLPKTYSNSDGCDWQKGDCYVKDGRHIVLIPVEVNHRDQREHR